MKFPSLRSLLNGESVAASRLNPRLVDELMAERLLVPLPHGRRITYRAADVNQLKQYLIQKDERYRLLITDDTSVRNDSSPLQRAELAAKTGNSKLQRVRSCPGFMVNTYEPIECRLHGAPFTIAPPDGAMVFISDWQYFHVPSDVTIVGIENMENFRCIRRQKEFFDKNIGNGRKLFVSRYPQSPDLRNWLMTIENKYIHFGDFDLAGISIFINEFQKHLQGRAEFLIPDDIDSRLSKGSSERYDKQIRRFHNLKSEDPRLQTLIDTIHRYRKGYDQEGYELCDPREN